MTLENNQHLRFVHSPSSLGSSQKLVHIIDVPDSISSDEYLNLLKLSFTEAQMTIVYGLDTIKRIWQFHIDDKHINHNTMNHVTLSWNDFVLIVKQDISNSIWYKIDNDFKE